jgi:microcystin-dependent protein
MVALNFPIGPEDGDTYEDYFYDAESSAWRLDPFPLETGPTGPQGAQGKFTVSPTPPVDPEEGDIWFYSEDGTSFIWYEDVDGAQWVEFGNLSQGPEGADGADGAQGATGPRGLSDTPAGVVVPWPSSTPPANWLLCDGSLVNKDEYPSLFDVIGYTYGSDEEDPDFFALPDISGRVVVGVDDTDVSFDTVGKIGGAKAHTLTTTELPSHTHTGVPHTHGTAGTLTTSNTGAHSHSGSTSNTGLHGHNSSIGNAGSHSHGGNTSNSGNHTHTDVRASTVSYNTSTRTSGNLPVTVSISSVNNVSGTTSTAGLHSHSITTDTEASHNHSISIDPNGSHSHNFDTNNTGGHSHTVTIETASSEVQSTGGGLGHNNLQPYITLNYIIKATGAEITGEPELAVRVTVLENAHEVSVLTVNTIVLDFTTGNWLLTRSVSGSSGDVEFSVFAYQTGAERIIRLVGDATARDLVFPTGWRFLGSEPSQLGVNEVGVLSLRCFGSNESDCVAQWGVSAP